MPANKMMANLIFIMSFFLVTVQSEAKLFQILHTNDTHSYLDHMTHEKSLGGMTRLKVLIDHYKSSMALQGIDSLVLDAGDFTEGNVYYMANRSRTTFSVYNQMNYDAGALGNHDYLMGIDELNQVLSEQKKDFSLLAANVSIPNKFSAAKEKIKPYKEIELGGIKFGIIGLTTNEIFHTWRLAPGKVTSPQDALEYYEEELNDRENDVIIALTHTGLDKDIKLAKKSRFLDLIVGGHSHDAVFKPIIVTSYTDKEVPILQAGKHTQYLGRLIVDIEKGSPLKIISYELIPNVNEIENAELKASVAKANQEVNDLYGGDWLNTVVGFSELSKEGPDGMLKWAYYITDTLKETTGADVAIHTPEMNGEEFPIGDITRRDLMNSIPRVFELSEKLGWSIYTTEIRGIWLKMTFEALGLFGQALTMSGVEAEYIKTPIGIKIKKILINGKKINPFKLYKVAFTEGIVRGAEGISPYTTLLLRSPKNTHLKIWSVLENNLKMFPLTNRSFLPGIHHQILMPGNLRLPLEH